MKIIPIKPEHRAEMHYLLGEVDRLNDQRAPAIMITRAVKRLSIRGKSGAP